MRVLLLGMPDVASCFDRVMRMPNLGIASIAANLEDAEVHVLDLVLHPRGVAETVMGHLEKLKPDIVGLSAMTFQYETAKEIAGIVRAVLPDARTVLGGYHATLAYDLISCDPGADVFDFLVRGEGEVTMNRLVQAIGRGGDVSGIAGLSYRLNGGFVHNPPAPPVDLVRLRLPARHARLSTRFTYFGRPFDVVETSRGCTRSCRFCSVRQMYGQSHRCYSIERVIEDIARARTSGAKGVFFVDDNINLRPGRLIELCKAIVESGLDDLEYTSQADVAGFLREPALAAAIKEAGFSGVFLGIESTSPDAWSFLGKRNSTADTARVVRSLRDAGIGVAGGFIVGNPDDDASAVRSAFVMARKLPLDHAIMWCLTPYPGTEAREEMMSEGLVENPADFRLYNGFICNARTRHLSRDALIAAISREGARLYFDPAFFLRSRAWPSSVWAAWTYFRTVTEYLTTARRNRLFASRHKMWRSARKLAAENRKGRHGCPGEEAMT